MTEWWFLGCTTCGHWIKGAVTKQQVADWFRTHPMPRVSKSTEGVTCESTCPHPCGSTPENVDGPTDD